MDRAQSALAARCLPLIALAALVLPGCAGSVSAAAPEEPTRVQVVDAGQKPGQPTVIRLDNDSKVSVTAPNPTASPGVESVKLPDTHSTVRIATPTSAQAPPGHPANKLPPVVVPQDRTTEFQISVQDLPRQPSAAPTRPKLPPAVKYSTPAFVSAKPTADNRPSTSKVSVEAIAVPKQSVAAGAPKNGAPAEVAAVRPNKTDFNIHVEDLPRQSAPKKPLPMVSASRLPEATPAAPTPAEPAPVSDKSGAELRSVVTARPSTQPTAAADKPADLKINLHNTEPVATIERPKNTARHEQQAASPTGSTAQPGADVAASTPTAKKAGSLKVSVKESPAAPPAVVERPAAPPAAPAVDPLRAYAARIAQADASGHAENAPPRSAEPLTRSPAREPSAAIKELQSAVRVRRQAQPIPNDTLQVARSNNGSTLAAQPSHAEPTLAPARPKTSPPPNNWAAASDARQRAGTMDDPYNVAPIQPSLDSRRRPLHSGPPAFEPQADTQRLPPIDNGRSWDSRAQAQELAAVARRAEDSARRGFELAERGALYSARTQFIDSLRTVVQALDAQEDATDHSRALATGLRALEEVDDFVPRGTQLDTDLNFRLIIDSHRTPVLKNVSASSLTCASAQRAYLTYAQSQLADAVRGQPVASLALHGLGKICIAPAEMNGPREQIGEAKAMAMFQAAMLVEPGNFLAANELGVLLTHCGRLDPARQALEHAALRSGAPTAWHNLAAVYQRLGEPQLAAEAHAQHDAAVARMTAAGYTRAGSKYAIDWIDPATFASRSSVMIDSPSANTAHRGDTTPPVTTAQPDKKSAFWPWVRR